MFTITFFQELIHELEITGHYYLAGSSHWYDTNMGANNKICQSCGMPLNENNRGTNNDHSLSDEYCYYCYEEGEFMAPNLTLNMQIERLANMAVERLNMSETQAREMAEQILPDLKRWK